MIEKLSPVMGRTSRFRGPVLEGARAFRRLAQALKGNGPGHRGSQHSPLRSPPLGRSSGGDAGMTPPSEIFGH
eukprot:5641191-Heterocapsa_arctica.AAC.1